MNRNIVFVDQLAGLDPLKVKREYGEIKDIVAAKRFGVRILKEFSYWSWRSCAIANVAMVLASEGLLKESLYDLVCEALLMNGYVYKNRRGKVDVGWKHSVLVKLLEKRGLKSKSLRSHDLGRVRKMLNGGSYVILSIKSQSGGHMVLIKMVDDLDVIYNDPYVFNGHGGENVKESLISFKNKFLGRGVVVC